MIRSIYSTKDEFSKNYPEAITRKKDKKDSYSIDKSLFKNKPNKGLQDLLQIEEQWQEGITPKKDSYLN